MSPTSTPQEYSLICHFQPHPIPSLSYQKFLHHNTTTNFLFAVSERHLHLFLLSGKRETASSSSWAENGWKPIMSIEVIPQHESECGGILDFALDNDYIYICLEDATILVYCIGDLRSTSTTGKDDEDNNTALVCRYNFDGESPNDEREPLMISAFNSNTCKQQQHSTNHRIIVGFENGSIQILSLDVSKRKLSPLTNSQVQLHSNILSDVQFCGSNPDHIVSCGMDYNVIQYSISKQKIINRFDIEAYVSKGKSDSSSLNQKKVFNPPHPHCLSLSTGTALTEEGYPKYAVIGLGNGDLICMDLDRNIVVRWIPGAHNYIVSQVDFSRRTEVESSLPLSFLSASNDGHIHSYGLKLPKKVKQRTSLAKPAMDLNHSEQALIYLAKYGLVNEENIEYISSSCARINEVEYGGREYEYLIVTDESGVSFCYRG